MAVLCGAATVAAQAITQRGFVEGTLFVFPQDAANDPTNAVGDLILREEVFAKPAAWIQFVAGADVRANSHGQVQDDWSVDYWDRGRMWRLHTP